MLAVHHFFDHAAAMVVPDSRHCAAAEGRHSGVVGAIVRQGSTDEAELPPITADPPLGDAKLVHGAAIKDLADPPEANYAASEVVWAREVIESNEGGVADVEGGEAERADGGRTRDLLDEGGDGEVDGRGRTVEERCPGWRAEGDNVGGRLKEGGAVGWDSHYLYEGMIESGRGDNGDTVTRVIVEELPNVRIVSNDRDSPR